MKGKLIKMKKSKIIVPAVALLALGMAASVTSTVAWFSSNSSVSASDLTVAVQGSNSLTISNGHSAYNWVYSLEWTDSALTMAPVTPIVGTYDATIAHYVSVQASGENAGKYTKGSLAEQAVTTSTLSFIKPGQGKVAADGSAAAIATSAEGADNSANYGAAANTDILYKDFALKLAGKVGDVGTIGGTVTVTPAAEKEIDDSFRVGLLDLTTSRFTVYGWTAGSTLSDGHYPVINFDSFNMDASYAGHEVDYKFRLITWYEGEDKTCIDANAIVNNLDVEVAFSVSSVANS